MGVDGTTGGWFGRGIVIITIVYRFIATSWVNYYSTPARVVCVVGWCAEDQAVALPGILITLV